MSEKRDLKWALEIVIGAAVNFARVSDQVKPDGIGDMVRQAADTLRNGGPVVEKKLIQTEFFVCEKHNVPLHICECKDVAWFQSKRWCKLKPIIQHWTEREKIQIFTEKSEPTFEPTPQ